MMRNLGARSARRLLTLLAATALVAFLMEGGAAADVSRLRLVDDRGELVVAAVEACFEVGLRRDCRHVPAGGAIVPPAGFDTVRIEGDDHGPAVIRRQDLGVGGVGVDGSHRVTLPRKALIHVAGARARALTLSLYDPHDPTFRTPACRFRAGAGDLKVPAGRWLASLAAPEHAPDLQRLQAAPGARVALTFHPRKGWSLVVRCHAAADGKPVRGAAVSLRRIVGYGSPDQPIGGDETRADGLALFSGIEAAMGGLAARHPAFLDGRVYGLTASPGTFAFRDIALGAGGRLLARVSVHGRPLAGAGCQIFALAPHPNDPRAAPYEKLWEGKVDLQGACRSGLLAAGSYKLRISVPRSGLPVSRWLSVVEGRETEEDVALAPIHVTGTVRKGRRPAAGYAIRVMPIDLKLPAGARADDAVGAHSDEKGAFELNLWAPGWYSFLLSSPEGSPAVGHKELTVEGDEEREVDFDLEDSSLHGVVVDESGRPVGDAAVSVRWAGVALEHTDGDGRFEVPFMGEGTASLEAGKSGYRRSEAVDVQVAEGVTLPAVTLVLKRQQTTNGTLLAARGDPVSGAWVVSTVADPAQGTHPFNSTRTGSDGGFEIALPASPTRVFAAGPGCPLDGYGPPADGLDEAASPWQLRCPESPAALDLTLLDEQGKPLPHAAVILRRGGVVVPQAVLANHLALLGLPVESDGSGHLVVAGISPGAYDLFLSTVSSESTIDAGRQQGYLTSVELAPLATTELQLTVHGER